MTQAVNLAVRGAVTRTVTLAVRGAVTQTARAVTRAVRVQENVAHPATGSTTTRRSTDGGRKVTRIT